MGDNRPHRILVLGASGMLGSAVLRLLAEDERLDVFASARSASVLRLLPPHLHDRIIFGVDVENFDSLTRLFATVEPTIVINCIGLVKQLSDADDPLAAIPINALLPHRLSRLCRVAGARFIHISTDCVFAGTRGMYGEADPSDATDLYGRSKYLGEVGESHAITLRTSIIGHELQSCHSLIGWFLAQEGPVRGFTRAIFSGLPTVELARVIRDHVIPRPALTGLYHVSAAPIAKYDLLKLVADRYGKSIEIVPDGSFVIDRSLDSSRFRAEADYRPPAWPELVAQMHAFG